MRDGVHSDVGVLRTVLVCRPGLAHLRLAPATCRALRFDTVLWVERAQRDFAQFVREMSGRGVEVLELHELLAQALAQPEARRWLLEREVLADAVGAGLADELRAALGELPPARLAELLIGGLAKADLPFQPSGALATLLELNTFVLPPLPNLLFARDASCWIGDGVCLNPLYGPARRGESLLMSAVYRFHPRFADAGVKTWWGDPSAGRDQPTLEGGDVMPLGEGVVLIGISERSSAQAVVQLGQVLLAQGAATTVIAAQMPPAGAATHLGAVFTQCAPDVVTYRPEVADKVSCLELRLSPHSQDLQLRSHAGTHLLDVVAEALQVPTLRAIATGGDGLQAGCEPWDDGNDQLALAPGVVIGYDRNTATSQRLRRAGVEVIEIPGGELARCRGGTRSMCCPIARDAVSYH